VLGDELAVSSVGDDLSGGSEFIVLLSLELGESPVLGHDDLLSSGELVLGTSEGLAGGGLEGLLGTDGNEDLLDVDTSDDTAWLSVGTSHSGLESISSSARKHLVDAEYVPWVDTDSHVETILSCELGNVLVGADTGGLESLGRELLEL